MRDHIDIPNPLFQLGWAYSDVLIPYTDESKKGYPRNLQAKKAGQVVSGFISAAGEGVNVRGAQARMPVPQTGMAVLRGEFCIVY
jgi:hypothetical protein